MEKLARHLGELNLNNFPKVRSRLGKKDFYDSQFNLSFRTAEYVRNAILFLMKEYDWDFLMVHLNITDVIQHHFWKFMDTRHPGHDPKSPQRYRNAIFDAYKKADDIIGCILDNADKDITVMVMSDHGFGPMTRKFYINNWFSRKGIFTVKEW